ncbi:MAG TPA: hypothetical protein VMI31_01455 [Fimbriimonadaceae bacterium]|nr:hypothetical protein [Fimbriimonadaceae bacterium]
MSAHRARSSFVRRIALASFALAFGGLPANAQNLLLDPQFNHGIGGFVTLPPGTLQWSAVPGPDNAPGVGSLRTLGPGLAFAKECVPVVAGRTYSWGASLKPESAAAWVILYFFANGTCSGSTILSEVDGPVVTGSEWQFMPSPDATAPAGASSVQFVVETTVGGAGLGGVDIDNVYFGLQGTSPPGLPYLPALSRPMAFLLAGALAVVGMRVLQGALAGRA